MTTVTLSTLTWALTELILTHGHESSNVSGFPNTGTWLVFGVILVPVYVMLFAWYTGKPRDLRTALLGTGVFFGLIIGLWIAMFIQMEIIGVVFY